MGPRDQPGLSAVNTRGFEVVVTGAGSGLGAAMAELLTASGHHVHLMGRRAEALAEVAARCRPGATSVHPGDVTDSMAVRAALDAVVNQRGRLDAVVNNAGIFRRASASKVALDEWHQVMDTNVTGALVVSQAALEVFRDQEVVDGARGHVVNVNSGAGTTGYAPSASYATSKHALMGLSDSLRREVATDAVKVTDLVVATAVESELSGRTGVRRLPASTVAAAVLSILAMPGEAVISRLDLGQLADWAGA